MTDDEELSSEHGVARAAAWFAAGSVVGLIAGVVLAERMGGRRGLARNARGVGGPAFDRAAALWATLAERRPRRRPAVALPQRVLEAFLNDPILSHRDLEIDADRAGTVTLGGQVRSPRELALAVTIARGVPGVRAVTHELEVRERASP